MFSAVFGQWPDACHFDRRAVISFNRFARLLIYQKWFSASISWIRLFCFCPQLYWVVPKCWSKELAVAKKTVVSFGEGLLSVSISTDSTYLYEAFYPNPMQPEHCGLREQIWRRSTKSIDWHQKYMRHWHFGIYNYLYRMATCLHGYPRNTQGGDFCDRPTVKKLPK